MIFDISKIWTFWYTNNKILEMLNNNLFLLLDI